MMTKKKISIQGIQKKKSNLPKYINTKIMKHKGKYREGKRDKKENNKKKMKQFTKFCNSKSFPINNYFICY